MVCFLPQGSLRYNTDVPCLTKTKRQEGGAERMKTNEGREGRGKEKKKKKTMTNHTADYLKYKLQT